MVRSYCWCRNYYLAMWNLFTNIFFKIQLLIQNLPWTESIGVIRSNVDNQMARFLPDYWHEIMPHILYICTLGISNLHHMAFSKYNRASSSYYCVSGVQVLGATCIIIFRRTFSRSVKYFFLLLLYFLKLVL